MGLTSIEWIASIIAIISVIKISVIIVNKNIWYNSVSKPLLSKPWVGWLFGILALYVLYLLLKTMSIIQIFAVVAFMSLVIGFAFMMFSKDFTKFANQMMKKKISGMMWVYMIFWLVLSLWALYEIYLV